jgi:hypothetical protein
MSLPEAILASIAEPTPDALWRLRGELLVRGAPAGAAVWPVLDIFHGLLGRLAAGTAARGYSERASKLDIAALGGIDLEELATACDGRELASRLLGSALSESLAVAATRQHVHAWQSDMEGLLDEVAWSLYGEMWRWAERRQPSLPGPERRALLDRLIGPARSSDAGTDAKVALLIRLFQILLLDTVVEALPPAVT